jgi:hypothetical protein
MWVVRKFHRLSLPHLMGLPAKMQMVPILPVSLVTFIL